MLLRGPAAVLALVLAATSTVAASSRTLTVGAVKRTYLLHVPSPRPPGTLPLVIILHGGGGHGKGMVRLTRGELDALADREGFLVAYPDGLHKRWNDGRGAEVSRTHRENTDDFGFLAALIDRLRTEEDADPARVYAAGISNGGMMACRLGCELAGSIAAIGIVAASMPKMLEATCAPARAVPVIFLCGTDDPLVPFGGGPVKVGRQNRGEVLGARAAAAKWAVLDGCPAAPSAPEALPDVDPQDGTRVSRETWGPGRDGAEVVLYTIEHGGHTWPGGRPYLPKFIVGRVSRDLDANAVLWAFFKRHRR
jgi:polyhydroxybutyrate depolymerase